MKISKKLLITAVGMLLIIGTAVGGTLAYIFSKTPEAPNSFTPVLVSCSVEESFDGETKSDVKIKNTGDIAAFVRATFVVTWTNDSGEVHSASPIESTDYTVTLGSPKWTKGSDGFYYYSNSVMPSEVTDIFISSISPSATAPNGYKLSVQIVATAIQSEPAEAVNEAWGATVQGTNGLVAP